MNAQTKPNSTKQRPPLPLTIGAAAALVGGGAIAFWALTRQQLNVMPIGANAIPQDALMVVSVSTDTGKWQQLREFGTPRSQAAFDQSLVQFRDRFLKNRGLEYARDIQPWIGKEVTMAFLPPQAGVTVPNPGQPAAPPNAQPTVMVVPIADALKAKDTLEKSPATQGAKWTERDYKGVKVRENQESANQSTSIAVLDTTQVLVANNPNAIERAIDTVKEGKSLAQTPGYGEALTQIQEENAIARLYVNIPAAANTSAANSSRPIPPQTLAQLQQNQGLAATAKLTNEGIQFKGISWLRPDSQRKLNTENTAKTIPTRLPTDTLMMASGGNLKQFWQDYTQGSASNPIQFVNPEALRQGIRTTVGLDLEKDLLNWMQGEYSLALLPAPQGAPAALPASLVFMVQTSDRRAAEATLKKLDEVMATKYAFKVEEAKVEGQSIVNWSLPAASVNITRGWLDGNVAFLSLGAPIASAILPKPTKALAENELFRKSTQSELAPHNGNFFVDMDRVLKLQNFPLLQIPAANRTVLEAISSIGVTAAVTSDRTSRYDVFVGLKKGNNPGALP
ncbi:MULTISPECIES: DUF3352 domain-containing protein [Leptolyngbya]|jgi:hypothetical protein|uniref:DUF3352 domain-containing protein n=1 Tax=Leptolyngbya boryana NIES-2135 TaxID=1973484 RepID=A0A1Z4JG28_LEPBY|nr:MULTISPECIES: DUF3352 domain-containing protein [Leptolyngbya]BAY55613.1 hypothetical protein NIES2135_24370 [Leptolyngbya boryana NIES-2135]MBD2369972.1 DUF3352 domain-containing protein [Leptolyngbya sp. FACHB-161]MBD2376326.1 DUF3352 domain-containing protein [Leptolyngbya sp. FACHB-238]MBD2400601.1 DUF3352 domain-containing protein [Leptolyngbya sp. FACHB-239]MBD2407143.1 DUF3352 domain-containing protein [Leptolyngbya sp. FACHB-402]